MPSLVLPFALVGLAAGWLSAGLLSNPLLHRLPPSRQSVAALAAGAAAALVGALLSRFAGPEAARRAPWATRLWALAVLLMSGAGAGLVVKPRPFGALGGLLAAAAFLPVFAAVLEAARRAARARLGSIVAGADRRAIAVILLSALAVTTLGALLDWPASAAGEASAPRVALALAAFAGASVAALFAADVRALVRLGRARASMEAMDPRDPGESALADDRVPRIDLGLGAEVRARLARGTSVYRYQDRVLSLIVGSADRARAALIRALGRGALAMGVIAAVLVAHGIAAGPRGMLAYCEIGRAPGGVSVCRAIMDEDACEAGNGARCRDIAHLLERDDAPPVNPGRAILLLRKGCELGDQVSCDELPAAPIQRSVKACMEGGAEACASLAARFAVANEPSREAYFADRACWLGAASACDSLHEVTAIHEQE